jgi:hypothetical protein
MRDGAPRELRDAVNRLETLEDVSVLSQALQPVA